MSMKSRLERVSVTHAILSRFLEEGKDILGIPESEPVLREYAIPFVNQRLVTSLEEAVEYAEEVGYPVVLKAIVPTIVHKTEGGFVRVGIPRNEFKECYEDLERSACREARSEYQGILIQEHITEAIELMVGITADPQYGPVIVYGTGGIFVELFEDTSYRQIPISSADAQLMIRETRGFKLLQGQRGLKPGHLESIVDILVKVSTLVEENPEIAEMDVNPILATSEKAVIVDCRIALVHPTVREDAIQRCSKPSRKKLSVAVHPRSVAIVGASRDETKLGGAILKNIIEGGFEGEVYPVNPKTDSLLGKKSYANISKIEGDVDLAVVAVPSNFVPSVLDQCGRKGVAGCIIISGGFSEIGEQGEALEQEISEVAGKYNMNILGPNCQGMNNSIDSLCASWPLQQKHGFIGIISQSGTVGAKIQELCVKEEVGFSYFFSLGNRLDLDEADLINFLNADELTKVIALYLEGPKNGRRLLRAFQSSTKPIVVLKSGRTPKGETAARFHASSLAGQDRVFDGILRQAHCLRVDTIDELFDACQALALLGPLQANEVVLITSSGGAGILATDYAEEKGLDVVELNTNTKDLLARSLPSNCIISNPLDLTGDTTAERYMKAAEIISGNMSVRTFLFIIGDPIKDTAQMILDARANLGVGIIPVYLGGGEVEQAEMSKLRESKIPTYVDPYRGIFAIYSMYSFNNLARD